MTDIVDPSAFPVERHRANLENFLDAVQKGQLPLVTGEEALKTELIRHAIYESAKQNRVLTLDYSDVDMDNPDADGTHIKTFASEETLISSNRFQLPSFFPIRILLQDAAFEALRKENADLKAQLLKQKHEE